MKQCCQDALDRLADTDTLVDVLMAVQSERDIAVREAKQANAAVQRVEDLHKTVVEDRKLLCRECAVEAPCPTIRALRGR
ncbi:Uncharacterised protein [Mycobacteroides abscessus subsp. massiliense]|nr:Uncharacterised protein [Mycobacteroides abscessus subsp. massiliense]